MKYNTALMLDGSPTSLFLQKEVINKKKFLIKLIIVSPGNKGKLIRKKYNFLTTNLKKKKNYLKKFFKENSIDIIFSYYNFKIASYILNNLNIGGINFHPSYLPYNKGRHSTFWGIYKNTPLGATSHWINNKYDDGDIFFQKRLYGYDKSHANAVYYAQLKILKDVIKNTVSKGITGVHDAWQDSITVKVLQKLSKQMLKL